MDIGTDARVVHIGIATFFHAKQRVPHLGLRGGQRPEAHQYVGSTIEPGAVHGLNQSGQAGTGLTLDLNMNDHEPFLIQTAQKVLQEHNVVECNRLRILESAPVVERI